MAEVKKEDRRIRKRKAAVHKAFFELLKEKDISDISIVELTDKADINRKTFYNHYADIYAVLDEIEKDMLVQLAEVMRTSLINSNMSIINTADQLNEMMHEVLIPVYHAAIDILENEPNYLDMLSKCEKYSNIISNSVKMQKEIIFSVIDPKPINTTWLANFLTFMTTGAMALIHHWYTSKQKISSDELVSFLSHIISSDTVFHFILQK